MNSAMIQATAKTSKRRNAGTTNVIQARVSTSREVEKSWGKSASRCAHQRSRQAGRDLLAGVERDQAAGEVEAVDPDAAFAHRPPGEAMASPAEELHPILRAALARQRLEEEALAQDGHVHDPVRARLAGRQELDPDPGERAQPGVERSVEEGDHAGGSSTARHRETDGAVGQRDQPPGRLATRRGCRRCGLRRTGGRDGRGRDLRERPPASSAIAPAPARPPPLVDRRRSTKTPRGPRSAERRRSWRDLRAGSPPPRPPPARPPQARHGTGDRGRSRPAGTPPPRAGTRPSGSAARRSGSR